MLKQIILWIFIVSLIVFRYFTTRPSYKDGDVIKITSQVMSDPAIFAKGQYLKIAGIKIYLPQTPAINYGDKIVVSGVIKNGVLQNPKVISIGHGGLFSILRNDLLEIYQKALPQPESGLIGGMVIGAKGWLDPDFYNSAKFTGVAHVVVASGTNVTFVISFLSAVAFLFLKRREAIPVILSGIITYLFISGFDAPLIRAAVMSGIAFIAQETGRLSSTIRIFFLTAGGMLVYNPDWIFDVGFLLSFASTGAIIIFQKRIAKLFKWLPGIIREDLSTTLSAQIGVTPILFVTFGQFNIWSPFINLLVLWTIPPLMIIGSAGGILGMVFEPLGRAILLLGYPMLWWFARVVLLFG